MTVASVEPALEVTCSRGVKLVADALIGSVISESFDLIALPVSGARAFKGEELACMHGCACMHARRYARQMMY